MLYSELISNLQNSTNIKISPKDIASVLHESYNTIYVRKQRDSRFNNAELKVIENFYNVKLTNDNVNNNSIVNFSNSKTFAIGDRVEITYWDQLPKDLYNPKIASVWFDREIIENDWKISPENLCIIPMIGDKMTNYWYPIRPNDILMIDTSHDYIMGNGVYFATSRNNTRLWIREMQILLDQTLEINGFAPSGNTRKIFTAPDLQQADFKIIGKVIKNVSFRL